MSTHFGGRTLARSQALQLLFQAEANRRTVEEVLDGEYALSEGPLDPYARELALGADAMRHELDAIIATRSTSWSLTRMPAVDRNLLRLALYEILEEEEVAAAVTIDESVELARAYCGDESPRFVNGLLGRVVDDLEEDVDVFAKAQEALAELNASEEEPEEEGVSDATPDETPASEADSDEVPTSEPEESPASDAAAEEPGEES